MDLDQLIHDVVLVVHVIKEEGKPLKNGFYEHVFAFVVSRLAPFSNVELYKMGAYGLTEFEDLGRINERNFLFCFFCRSVGAY